METILKLQDWESEKNILQDEVSKFKKENDHLRSENTRLKIENVNLSHKSSMKNERPSVIIQKAPIKIERFVTQTEVIEKGNKEYDELKRKYLEIENLKEFLERQL